MDNFPDTEGYLGRHRSHATSAYPILMKSGRTFSTVAGASDPAFRGSTSEQVILLEQVISEHILCRFEVEIELGPNVSSEHARGTCLIDRPLKRRANCVGFSGAGHDD